MTDPRILADLNRIANAQERQAKAADRIAKAAEEQAENVAWIGDLIHEFWSWLPDNESSIPIFEGKREDEEKVDTVD